MPKSRSPRSTLALALLVAALPFAHGRAQSARATEHVVLVVEVLERDPTPVIPCGVLGSQRRDVTARVLAVEAGMFTGERILLSWPMCANDQVVVGEHYRIHVRRFADTPASPDLRYRVRRAEHVARE